MQVLLLIALTLFVAWPLICWSSYRIMWWQVWENRYRRDPSTHNTLRISTLNLKRFWGYNRIISAAIEPYGINFVPSKILLFHEAFCIPWSDIMACEYKPGRISSRCLLHTRYGVITVYGEVGEIIARACKSNYINEVL